MQVIAEYRKKIVVGAILAVIIVTGLAVSAIWIAPKNSIQQNALGAQGAQSQLVVQLTDPPIVPVGTTSLNLTYTEIDLQVVDQNALSTVENLTYVPSGGFSILDLMNLENTSQTLSSSSLPTGSDLISVTFLVSSIEIDVNRTSYPVVLATGDNLLIVPLISSSIVTGANALLLQLNPTIINSSTGYQMVPSSLGIMKPQSEITNNDPIIGYSQKLSVQDLNELHHARGSLSAELVSLSVSGSITTMSIQITNTGSGPERLVLFGIHGDFNWVCPSFSQDTTGSQNDRGCHGGVNEVLFLPGEPQNATVTTTTTVSNCAPRHISLVNAKDIKNEIANPIIMNPSQCLMFNFSGSITIAGFGNHILVPSMELGQKYIVHVVATNGAQTKISCIIQKSSPVCPADSDDNGED